MHGYNLAYENGQYYKVISSCDIAYVFFVCSIAIDIKHPSPDFGTDLDLDNSKVFEAGS